MREMLAYLSHAHIPSRSANSVHVMKMCDGFIQAGCAVALVARRGSERLDATPAAFYGTSPDVRLEFVTEYPTPAGRLLYSWAGARRASHLGATWAFGRDLAGCYFAARHRIPVAHETHSPPSLLTAAKRGLFARLIRSAGFRGLVVITQGLKSSYQEAFDLPAHRIHVLPDAASEPSASERTIAASARLSVGYVGHLYPGKGMELIADLAAACDWADFHVVGGREQDLRYWRERCGARHNVHFHGFVPHAQLDGYVASFDVVLAPYQERVTVQGQGDISTFMSPLKLFEYMAARKPILCSDLPVLHEVMRHGDNCLLLPPADVGAWHAALRRLRDEPGLRMRLAAAAYADFQRCYTWRARADRVLAVLRDNR